MKVFVSYSYRPNTEWVDSHVIPLIECFGHEAVTGRLLDAGAIPEEVRAKIQTCRRVLCFVTRNEERYGPGGATGTWTPPDWVRDEMMMARGAGLKAIEFRERGVTYDGESPFHAWHDFERDALPDLMLRLAKLVAEWPVGPLQLRLTIPEPFRAAIEAAAMSGQLTARCVLLDASSTEITREELPVRVRDGQLTVPFWVKADPSCCIEIEVRFGDQRFVCGGISAVVRDAPLRVVGGA